MSKKRFSSEEKYEILMTYYNGNHTTEEIAKQYKVHTHTIYDWLYKYEELGAEGLKESEGWKRYSKELKLAAVRDYMSGKYSLREIVLKYKISDKSVLKKWIKLYNIA